MNTEWLCSDTYSWGCTEFKFVKSGQNRTWQDIRRHLRREINRRVWCQLHCSGCWWRAWSCV